MFKDCHMGRERELPGMEYANEFFDSLHQALAGEQFATIAEAQAFLNQFMRESNTAARDDLHSLTPDQAYAILYEPFASPDVVSFPNPLAVQPDAPVITLFSMLVDAIGEKGLKTTATGNLPRNFCREGMRVYLGDKQYEFDLKIGAFQNETECIPVTAMRYSALAAGLIRKFKGKFVVTKKCRGILEKQGMAGVYSLLFRTYVAKINWGFIYFTESPWMSQGTFAFALYLFSRYGDEWRPAGFYTEAMLRAFPDLIMQIKTRGTISPERLFEMEFTSRFIRSFMRLYGLLEMEEYDYKAPPGTFKVHAQPLLEEIVQFKL